MSLSGCIDKVVGLAAMMGWTSVAYASTAAEGAVLQATTAEPVTGRVFACRLIDSSIQIHPKIALLVCWSELVQSSMERTTMQKSIVDMNLDERKIQLISNLFIEPADSSYLSARWHYDVGLFHGFYWSACQSIEKMTKAIILLNNESTLLDGHDIRKLLARVNNLGSSDIMNKKFDLVDSNHRLKDRWDGVNYQEFVEYINFYGAPDNRYGVIGLSVDGPILLMLDIIFHELRVFARSKNFVVGDIFIANNENQHVDDQISAPLDWMLSPDYLLERLYRRRLTIGLSQQLIHIFRKMNYPFFGDEAGDGAVFGGVSWRGSPAYNLLVRLGDSSSDAQKNMTKSEKDLNSDLTRQLRDWAHTRIKFSRNIKNKINFI